MDLLCDNIIEEILLRLPAKHLHRMRAVSRRYNDIIILCSSDFAARHWQRHSPYLSGGVFLQHTECLPHSDSDGGGTITPRSNWESSATFITSSTSGLTTLSSAEPNKPAAFSADPASFLPSPNDREIAYLQHCKCKQTGSVVIVHSSAGLLLCCRGHVSPVHYYVCDPLARRFAALPELPRPSPDEQSGLLCCVDAVAKRFQVVLFDQRREWGTPGGSMCLEVLSLDTCVWTPVHVPYPANFSGFQSLTPPFLTQSGKAAYWLGFCPSDKAVLYSSTDHSLRLIPVPARSHDISALNRCIGERSGGGLRYAHFDAGEFQVWDGNNSSSAGAGGDDNHWTWTLVHRVTVKEVPLRSPGAPTSLFSESNSSGSMLRWIATSNQAYWCMFFTVLGFDPIHEDVFFFEAFARRRLATYSMGLRELKYRCPLVPGATSAPFDMFPYVPTTSPGILQVV